VLLKNDRQGLLALRDLRSLLAGTPWVAADLETAVKTYAEQKQLGLGKVAQPLRVAVTGGTVSPPIFESIQFLGQAATLARIDRCLAAVGA
jgi:glutamyl-tRNA synthetase